MWTPFLLYKFVNFNNDRNPLSTSMLLFVHIFFGLLVTKFLKVEMIKSNWMQSHKNDLFYSGICIDWIQIKCHILLFFFSNFLVNFISRRIIIIWTEHIAVFKLYHAFKAWIMTESIAHWHDDKKAFQRKKNKQNVIFEMEKNIIKNASRNRKKIQI